MQRRLHMEALERQNPGTKVTCILNQNMLEHVYTKMHKSTENTEKVWNLVFETRHNNQSCLLCRNIDEVV
jgi:hypothetical protein